MFLTRAHAPADKTRSSPCSRLPRHPRIWLPRLYRHWRAQWGRDRPIELMHRLGYRRTPRSTAPYRGSSPASTRRRSRPPSPVGSPISSWATGRAGLQAVAIDGKSSRTADVPAAHLLATMDRRTGCALAPGPRPGRNQRAQGSVGPPSRRRRAAGPGDHRRRRLLPAAICAARSSPASAAAEPRSRSTTTSRRSGRTSRQLPSRHPLRGRRGRPARRRRWTSMAAGSSGVASGSRRCSTATWTGRSGAAGRAAGARGERGR